MINTSDVKFVLIAVLAVGVSMLVGEKTSEAKVSWTPASESLYESSVDFIEVHPEEPDTIFAGVKGRLYRSKDAGDTWKSILTLKSSSSIINIIRINRFDPERILVGTDEGVYLSRNDAKSWKRIFYRPDELQEKVLSLASSHANSNLILVGTANGLFLTQDGGKRWVSSPQFVELRIFQIDCSMKGSEGFTIAASDGLYAGDSGYSGWKKLYHAQVADKDKLTSLSFVMGSGSNSQRITVFDGNSIFVSENKGQSWRSASVNAFPQAVSREPMVLSYDTSKMFVPTSAGIFIYDESSGDVRDISGGLPSKQINSLAYDAQRDTLFAGTERGVFKLTHPEMTVYLAGRSDKGQIQYQHLLSYFDHEPPIQELIDVAMRYAEVHPEKISQWRRRVKQSSWLPDMSIAYDRNTDGVVELDRGGTNDPDIFINGPEETDTDWSVDFTWDLSDVLWNDDQLSIDNRSKLMVQLREDILNQLIHLYYARRRLQVSGLMSPATDIAQLANHELQIAEYTAGIDALTGGYFTRSIGPILRDSSWLRENSLGA